MIQYLISLDGEVVLSNSGATGPEIYFVYLYCVFGLVVKKLNLMYQKSGIRHNDERKDNIFYMQFPLHNITHEKIQKYMLILLLNDFC